MFMVKQKKIRCIRFVFYLINISLQGLNYFQNDKEFYRRVKLEGHDT